ncbi:MAG: enoyl-CoA hydratase/isomerase family protein [Dehalococcoidia bacterium]
MAGVTYTRQDRIASIHIDAAATGNAFTPEIRRQLNAALLEYRRDDEAWMGVISSAGPDFCVGTQEPAPTSTRERRERALLWGGGFVEIWKPTIAAVQGQCRGEGLALALSCDLRVADETSMFSADLSGDASEPNVVAAWLINLVGISSALELLWLRRTLDAHEAQRIGLVNRLTVTGPKSGTTEDTSRFPMNPMPTTISVPDGSAGTAGMYLAEELLQYAPVTRVFQKEIALRSVGAPFHYAQTLELGPNPYASEDRIEGTRAFVENRRPTWHNR